MPGTDTCIKIGGFVRAEVNFGAGGSFTPLFQNWDARSTNTQNWRTRAGITADARSQTAYGTLRGYAYLAATSDNSGTSGTPTNGTGASAYDRMYSPAAFIQFAGFTMGRTGSFFDFDSQPYSNQSNVWSSFNGGNGVELWAYTAQLGNGLSASISAENNNAHRMGVATATGTSNTAGGQSMPDIVGNLRIDQAWGSAQIMGAYHQVNYGVVGNPDDEAGWAFGAGLKVNLPMLGKGDYIMGQFTYGVGAIDYVGSGLAQAQTTQRGGTISYGPAWDSVITGAGTADLTTGWSITGGFEHNWVPGWKTSLYGSYGKLEYSTAASASLQLAAAGTTAGSSANWSYWQVGSRTVWTPVTNLDLSVEVMYQVQNTAFTGANIGDNSWWSGMFRAQRNFYP
nr:porin [Pseudolabrys sp. FHR47]